MIFFWINIDTTIKWSMKIAYLHIVYIFRSVCIFSLVSLESQACSFFPRFTQSQSQSYTTVNLHLQFGSSSKPSFFPRFTQSQSQSYTTVNLHLQFGSSSKPSFFPGFTQESESELHYCEFASSVWFLFKAKLLPWIHSRVWVRVTLLWVCIFSLVPLESQACSFFPGFTQSQSYTTASLHLQFGSSWKPSL